MVKQPLSGSLCEKGSLRRVAFLIVLFSFLARTTIRYSIGMSVLVPTLRLQRDLEHLDPFSSNDSDDSASSSERVSFNSDEPGVDFDTEELVEVG